MRVIFQSCEHLSPKFVLPKMLKTWLLLFLRLTLQTCNCSDIFFSKRYSLTRAALFFLNTSYLFGSRYFLISLSGFFFFGDINGLLQITLLLAISSTVTFAFFCLPFSITLLFFVYHFQ